MARPYNKLSWMDREQVKHLYSCGWSTHELSCRFAVSTTAIRNALQKAGVARRSKSDAVTLAYRRGRKPWHKGRIRQGNGYILVLLPSHPRANASGYVFEHILVAERELGRVLAPNEHVHHRNGIKDDNAPQNLEVLTISEHRSLHARERWTLGLWYDQGNWSPITTA